MAKVLFPLKNQSLPSYYRTHGETTPDPVDYLRVHQVLLADPAASDDIYGRPVRFAKQVNTDLKNISHPYVLYIFYTDKNHSHRVNPSPNGRTMHGAIAERIGERG